MDVINEMTDRDLLHELGSTLNELDVYGDKLAYTSDVVIPNAEKLLRLARSRISQLMEENAALRAQLAQSAPDA